MTKRNLLICFDAFGTLFTPRKPIAQQYGDVARACGLGGFSDEDVGASFKKGMYLLERKMGWENGELIRLGCSVQRREQAESQLWTGDGVGAGEVVGECKSYMTAIDMVGLMFEDEDYTQHLPALLEAWTTDTQRTGAQAHPPL